MGVKNAESREPIKTSTSSYISVRELRLSVPVSRLPFAPEAALAVFSFDMATTDLGSTEDEVPRQLGFRTPHKPSVQATADIRTVDLPATVHSVYTTRTQQLTKDSLLRYTDGTPVRIGIHARTSGSLSAGSILTTGQEDLAMEENTVLYPHVSNVGEFHSTEESLGRRQGQCAYGLVSPAVLNIVWCCGTDHDTS